MYDKFTVWSKQWKCDCLPYRIADTIVADLSVSIEITLWLIFHLVNTSFLKVHIFSDTWLLLKQTLEDLTSIQHIHLPSCHCQKTLIVYWHPTVSCNADCKSFINTWFHTIQNLFIYLRYKAFRNSFEAWKVLLRT